MKNLTKLLFLAILLFVLCLSSFAQNSTPQNAPNIGTPDYLLVKRGFKIFKLGDPIDKYSKYVKFVADINGVKSYKVIDPKFLSIGNNVKLNEIYLKTYKAKLKSIIITVDSINKRNLFSTLLTAYGSGKKTNRFSENYLWSSTDGKILLKYFGEIKDRSMDISGFAEFSDTELQNQKERDNNVQIDNNVADI